MASLDFPTIAIIGLLLNIGLAVGFSLILLVMRGQPVPRLWAASLWAGAVSTVMVSLPVPLPEPAAILVRNAFAVLGSMLMLFGVALHVGRRAPVRPALALAGGYLLAIVWFSTARPDLGIRLVDREVLEASRAFGANPRQQLFGVQLPLALPNIMAGINQTTMMALSMVVIASMIGARGLGYEVLLGINRLEVGRGLLAGLAFLWVFLFVPMWLDNALDPDLGGWLSGLPFAEWLRENFVEWLRSIRSTIFSVWLAYTVVWMAYGLRLISSTLLQVGPESAGSTPGPACYGRGNTRPTVTDANVLLGRIAADRPLGGGLLAVSGVVFAEFSAKRAAQATVEPQA